MQQIEVESGKGRHRVLLSATVTEKGIMCVLVGGDEPHLGAVVLTLPRPGLADPGRTSCTTSILPLLGHKDDEAARPLAELLAVETGHPVCVSAGMHIKGATPADIDSLIKNTMECGKKLLELIVKKSD